MIPPSTQMMPRTAGRMPPAQLEHDIAAPRLPGDDGAREPERLDQRLKVADGGIQAIARLRRVRAAVAALVDGHHRVTSRMEVLGDAIPEPQVRGEPVDEDERHGGGIAVAPLSVERDARGHGHLQLGDRRPVRLTPGLSHGPSPGSRAMVVCGPPTRKPVTSTLTEWRVRGRAARERRPVSRRARSRCSGGPRARRETWGARSAPAPCRSGPRRTWRSST